MLTILVYIDPGTGSIILQAVVAGVVGGAIAVKVFWHRILRFFGLRHDDPEDIPSEDDDKQE